MFYIEKTSKTVDGYIITENKSTLVGDKKVSYYILKIIDSQKAGERELVQVIIPLKDKFIIGLTRSDYKNIFNQILSTFRFD